MQFPSTTPKNCILYCSFAVYNVSIGWYLHNIKIIFQSWVWKKDLNWLHHISHGSHYAHRLLEGVFFLEQLLQPQLFFPHANPRFRTASSDPEGDAVWRRCMPLINRSPRNLPHNSASALCEHVVFFFFFSKRVGEHLLGAAPFPSVFKSVRFYRWVSNSICHSLLS